MKIFCNNTNPNQDEFLRSILDIDDVYKNMELHFNNDEIYILNKDYKNPVRVEINFNDSKFIGRNNRRLKDKKDIFWKIFSSKNSSILDCTGGFGKDAFLLDSMGHDVTMLENSPIVSLLLKNALDKINDHNINLFFGNAYDFISHSNEKYDYIYFDFMFEKLKNTSPSTKDIETLKKISFKNNDKNQLIKIAKKKINKYVVVKEPTNSISGLIKPNHTYKSKLLMYNIYISSND